MENTRINCDHCGADLTYTGNAQDYYIEVSPASKRHQPGLSTVTALYITPPMERDYHFCSWVCLDRWRPREVGPQSSG